MNTNEMKTPEVPMSIELPDALGEVAPSEPASVDSDVNWSDFAGEKGSESFDEDEPESVEGDVEVLEPKAPVVEAPAVQTPAAVVPPAVPAVPPVAVPPVQAVVPPAPVQQAAPPAAPVAPVPQPFDSAKWETEQLGKLEKMYAIDEADAQALQTEPEMVLPKMAARMHMDITRTILASVQAMLPDFMQNHQQVVSADQQARTAFYTANPDLTEHEASVLKVAQMFRAANPNAPRDVAIKTIGEMTRMALGIVPAPTNAPPPTGTASQQEPPAAKPFMPSRGGGGGAMLAPKPKTIWDEMSED